MLVFADLLVLPGGIVPGYRKVTGWALPYLIISPESHTDQADSLFHNLIPTLLEDSMDRVHLQIHIQQTVYTSPQINL